MCGDMVKDKLLLLEKTYFSSYHLSKEIPSRALWRSSNLAEISQDQLDYDIRKEIVGNLYSKDTATVIKVASHPDYVAALIITSSGSIGWINQKFLEKIETGNNE